MSKVPCIFPPIRFQQIPQPMGPMEFCGFSGEGHTHRLGWRNTRDLRRGLAHKAHATPGAVGWLKRLIIWGFCIKGGIPKMMVYHGKSQETNGWFWGTPISGNLHILILYTNGVVNSLAISRSLWNPFNRVWIHDLSQFGNQVSWRVTEVIQDCSAGQFAWPASVLVPVGNMACWKTPNWVRYFSARIMKWGFLETIGIPPFMETPIEKWGFSGLLAKKNNGPCATCIPLPASNLQRPPRGLPSPTQPLAQGAMLGSQGMRIGCIWALVCLTNLAHW